MDVDGAVAALEEEVAALETHFRTTMSYVFDADLEDVPELLDRAWEEMVELIGARLALDSLRAIAKGRLPAGGGVR